MNKKPLTINDVRDVVREFAIAMEEQLRANDHKGGWDRDRPDALLARLEEEVAELKAEIRGKCRECGRVEPFTAPEARPHLWNVRREAADVANFAMFIADRLGALKKDIHRTAVKDDLTIAVTPAECPLDGSPMIGPGSCQEYPKMPGPEAVTAAKAEMQRENEDADAYYKRPDIVAQVEENRRRSNLPSEHPEHICGMLCDGQDGSNSDCARLRRKLGFR